MMINNIICFFILFITFLHHCRSKICQIRTSSGFIKHVCCTDYEAKDNGCIPCLNGYTSDNDENCRPCSNNKYGERCRYECNCSDFEICDNVEGCIEYSPTTGSSVFATSDSFIPVTVKKTCEKKYASGKIENVCCADYEERGNGCIACFKGYTSDTGQNCVPCQKMMYGEGCRYECNCSGFEICDHVNGCVKPSSTTEISVVETDYDMSLKLITSAATDYVDDISSSHDELNTNGESTDCSVKGLLSRELIVYSALSVLVSGFGMCLCFVFLKYRTLMKKFTITISQTQNSLIPQQIEPRETADRLYDIINDEDILDNQRLQQMQMSSNYLDVIHDSNTRESCENNCFVNQDNPCLILSIIKTQNQDNNLNSNSLSLKSGDSTSSSDEYQWDSTQDYLNPYQPMIDISPPLEHKYLTIATTHIRGDGNYEDSTVVRNAYELQHPREMEKDAMTNLHDNYKKYSVRLGSNGSKGVSDREGGKESKSYENLNVEWFKIEVE